MVAYEVARQLNVPAIFTERLDGEMVLRRGFLLDAGQRALGIHRSHSRMTGNWA